MHSEWDQALTNLAWLVAAGADEAIDAAAVDRLGGRPTAPPAPATARAPAAA